MFLVHQIIMISDVSNEAENTVLASQK